MNIREVSFTCPKHGGPALTIQFPSMEFGYLSPRYCLKCLVDHLNAHVSIVSFMEEGGKP